MITEISITAPRWPAWLNAAGLLVESFVAVAALLLQVRPGTDIVAVIFPPWWSQLQVFAAARAADARIVRLTAISSVLVVRPADGRGLKDLRDAGVRLAINPQAVAACFTTPQGI